MSDWQYWFKRDNEYTPIEIADDGSVTVIYGMCYVFPLDEMKKRARKIWEVDDFLAPTKADLIYEEDRDGEPAKS